MPVMRLGLPDLRSMQNMKRSFSIEFDKLDKYNNTWLSSNITSYYSMHLTLNGYTFGVAVATFALKIVLYVHFISL